MLENKATSFAKAGDHTLARFTQMFSPVFVPREDVATAAPPTPASAELAPANETAVSKLKRRLQWDVHHDEDEWVKQTGMNLLILACCVDDLAAVEELLAGPDAPALLKGVGKTCDALDKPNVKLGNGPHRRAPFNVCMMQYAHKLNAIQAAMTFASPPVVEALLDAGADVSKDGILCLGVVHCHFKGAIMAGKVDNVRLFLDRHPEFINAKAPLSDDVPLHFACFIGKGQHQVSPTLLSFAPRMDIGSSTPTLGPHSRPSCPTFPSLNSFRLLFSP